MIPASRSSFPQSAAPPGRALIANRTYRKAAAFLAVVCFAVWVQLTFYDQFWWPPDDGAYAHVAQRILAGEVLNRDIQDLHAGYINFTNALALSLFGPKLVAMRYPLALLGVVEACIVFFLLLPRGTLVATAGAAAMTALGFIQFLNPTAHWYALFLFIVLLGTLTAMPRESRWRLELVGFLLATIFLYRQLTGVLVAIGVLTYLLCEPAGSRSGFRNRLLARTVLAIMGVGLLGYLIGKADWGAAALFGFGPMALIIWVAVYGADDNRGAARTVGKLGLGAFVGLIPLVIYHWTTGSLGAWIDDAFLAAFALTELPFFSDARYARLLLIAIAVTSGSPEPWAWASSLFWIAVLLLAPITAFLTMRALASERQTGAARGHLLPFLTSFYALAAVHFQIPVYLMYTAASSLIGLLWFATPRSYSKPILLGLAAFLVAAGLYFQAGQPMTRGYSGTVSGTRVPAVAVPDAPAIGLRVPADDAARYRDLLRLIENETAPNAFILALPVNPELYFLSGRRNPTRFFNAALGMRNESEFQAVLETLRRNPPQLVFFQPNDKYNTVYVHRLVELVRGRYEMLPARGGFEIYRALSASGPSIGSGQP